MEIFVGRENVIFCNPHSFSADSYKEVRIQGDKKKNVIVYYIGVVIRLCGEHIFDYTWYVWLKVWGEVSKFKFVIGSLKPFRMLNPFLLLLKPALSTLGIKPVFTMIGLKKHRILYRCSD